MINWLGGTRFGVWSVKYLISPIQRWIYLRTDGRFGTTISPGRNVLLLTTKGRRPGQDMATYRGHEATEAESQRLWPRLIELWPAYQTYYQQSGQRSIFILNRV